MNKKERLYVIISIVLFLLGGFFCFKAMNTTKKSSVSEKSSANYVVCLKENNYYRDTCLEEEREYVASLTDKIRITFNYTKVSKFKNKLEYYIGTNIKISNRDNSKEVFNREKVITDVKKITNEKNVINIVENIDIDYGEYEKLVKEYKEDYELNTSAVLQVYLKVKEGNKENIVSSLSIPINEITYSISKYAVDDNNANNVSDEGYKGELLIGILAIMVSIAIIVLTIIKSKENENISEFELEAKRLLTEYDRIIVETKLDSLKLTGKELIEINDFMELIDVRDTIEKPIMYFKRSEYSRDFIVQDGDIVYRYRMIDKNKMGDNKDEDPIITKIENNKKIHDEETKAKEVDHFHTKTIEIPILKEDSNNERKGEKS